MELQGEDILSDALSFENAPGSLLDDAELPVIEEVNPRPILEMELNATNHALAFNQLRSPFDRAVLDILHVDFGNLIENRLSGFMFLYQPTGY
jgi:hypothetical protein